MLGVVSFDHLIMVFICWELTSVLSFFLIAFDPENPKARKGALHAALVTGAGGLCLLLAVLMIQHVAGTWSLQELLMYPERVSGHAWAPVIAGLVLAAGLTKSAFFPFSFWLPGAMTAPTPVSSYLHSATMVKAGIFLLMRLNPVFSGVEIWSQVLMISGGITFLLGALRSVTEDDLKAILAYTTISSLGLMGFLIGWGSEFALLALPVYLTAHALYKCGLFQVAGIIDHETGTRLTSQLGGLKKYPFFFGVAVLLGVSGLGLAPTYTFLAKEKILLSMDGQLWPLALLFFGFVFSGAGIFKVVLSPFLKPAPAGLETHKPPFGLILSPLVLGFMAFTLVFWQGQVKDLWHGINLELILSLTSVILAYFVFMNVGYIGKAMPLSKILGSDYFDFILKKHFSFALRVTQAFQNGSLRFYFLTILISAMALILWQWPHEFIITWNFEYSLLWSIVGALLVLKLFALVYVVKTENPLIAVLSLGLVGYAVAVLFALYGAPDLAMTQFAVETLSVFLFVFVLKDVPRFKERSASTAFGFDLLMGLFSGVLIFALSWIAVLTSSPSRLKDYFSEMSLIEAHGRNVVNVILVDFRGFDTMGEITVLGIAAIGVVALLKISQGKA